MTKLSKVLYAFCIMHCCMIYILKYNIHYILYIVYTYILKYDIYYILLLTYVSDRGALAGVCAGGGRLSGVDQRRAEGGGAIPPIALSWLLATLPKP